MILIRIISLATGAPTEIDGAWVRDFDPRPHAPGYSYPTGELLVTRDRTKALRFPSMAAAVGFYRQAYGTRPDGQPNRPLTAFTVAIEPEGCAT